LEALGIQLSMPKVESQKLYALRIQLLALKVEDQSWTSTFSAKSWKAKRERS
jgi:hypothetical protein